MDEMDIRKQALVKAMEVEYLPSIPADKLPTNTCKKYPMANLTALGIGFQPLVAAIQSIAIGNAGTSGLYYVNTKGKQMATFRNKSGFLGSLLTDEGMVGGGQSVISPLNFDPTMLCMAATMMNIEKKLDDITELQQDILSFLQAKEKAKLRGNVNVLMDILNNYKFNWDNEKYKNNKHILVQDIKKEAEQSILLYQSQLEKTLSKQDSIHIDTGLDKTMKKVQEDLKDYRLSLYLYSFSSFLEVMLLENFDKEYLEGVAKRMEEYGFKYREIYTECYNQLEDMSKSSVQSLFTKGFSNVAKGVGKAIEKVPVVSKGPVDEFLIGTGDKLHQKNEEKTSSTMSQIVSNSADCTTPFIENVKSVNRIYNQPLEVLFDKENVYLVEE